MNFMDLFEKHSDKLLKNHYEAVAEEKQAHAGRVRGFADQIAGRLEGRKHFHPDRSLLRSAAALHDIAKLDKPKKHHKKAKAAIAQEYKSLTGSPLEKKELKRLSNVIRFHKGKDFDPPEPVALEAAILRVADKIDKTARGESGAKKAFKESLEAIKKSGLLGKKKRFKRFKKACNKVRKAAKKQFASKGR